MSTRFRRNRLSVVLALLLGYGLLACAVSGHPTPRLHSWWQGLGPVLPHDSFPAECSLCHTGDGWRELTEDFEFDHEERTGVRLEGAHTRARCLRCHNDRGPAAVFTRQGCAGCHEDVHQGQLGTDCRSCHQQETWRPEGQIERHQRTRFPLVGTHAVTSCRRCHLGAETGKFLPTDVECVTCHRDDLAGAKNPDHIALGWIERCDRCHMPTTWHQAETN